MFRIYDSVIILSNMRSQFKVPRYIFRVFFIIVWMIHYSKVFLWRFIGSDYINQINSKIMKEITKKNVKFINHTFSVLP